MNDPKVKVTDLEKKLCLSFWLKFLEERWDVGKLCYAVLKIFAAHNCLLMCLNTNDVFILYMYRIYSKYCDTLSTYHTCPKN